MVRVWDLETGECLRTLEGHTRSIEAVALHADGRRALTGSMDKTVRVWDLETGKSLGTWGGEECVSSAEWCKLERPGHANIVAGCERNVLFLELMPPGRMVPETVAVAWHPSRPLLAVARANGTLLVQAWHPESQYLEEVCRTTIPSNTCVQWSTDGACLFATTKDGTRRALDPLALAEIAPASASGDLAPPSDISPDGAWRAVIRDGKLEVVPSAGPAPVSDEPRMA
jgi:WD40 repeat protein